MDQGRETERSGPKDTTKIDNVLWSLSSQVILAQTKINIRQQAVAKFPYRSIAFKGIQMPSPLVSRSQVSLIHQTYFKEHLLSNIKFPMGEKADVHFFSTLL